jgi:hypothetical protein
MGSTYALLCAALIACGDTTEENAVSPPVNVPDGGSAGQGGSAGSDGGGAGRATIDATPDVDADGATQPGDVPWLGWSTGAGRSDLSRLDLAAASGANLTVAYYGTAVTPQGAVQFLDRMRSIGTKALLGLEETWISGAQPDSAAITELVTAVKSHPALLGYYLADEPEFNSIVPAQLKAAYDVIRAADADHPISISFGDGYCSYADRQAPASPAGDTYMTVPDIVLFDQYPVHDQPEFERTSDGRHGLEDIRDMVHDCMTYLASHHGPRYEGFIAILQGFSWGGASDRDPTYAESRYMLFRSLIESPYGAVHWVEYQASATLTPVVHRLIEEASSLGAALRSSTFDAAAVTSSVSTVHYAYSARYLVAVNDAAADANGVRFTLPASVTAAQAKLVSDRFDAGTSQYASRTVTIDRSAPAAPSFTDDFRRFEVHVYDLAQ